MPIFTNLLENNNLTKIPNDPVLEARNELHALMQLRDDAEDSIPPDDVTKTGLMLLNGMLVHLERMDKLLHSAKEELYGRK